MAPLLSPEEIDALFGLAGLGIRAGLGGEGPPALDLQVLSPALRRPGAAFVTLEIDGQLNGCIGSVVPAEPLGAAVPELAWRAAFADPRLPALTPADYQALEIKLSLIGPLQAVPAGSEEELLANLRPGVDGVLIRWGAHDATFLPAVWGKLQDPVTFLRHLEAKAGLRPGQWPPGIEGWRYETADHRRRAVEIDSPNSRGRAGPARSPAGSFSGDL